MHFPNHQLYSTLYRAIVYVSCGKVVRANVRKPAAQALHANRVYTLTDNGLKAAWNDELVFYEVCRPARRHLL